MEQCEKKFKKYIKNPHEQKKLFYKLLLHQESLNQVKLRQIQVNPSKIDKNVQIS